MNTMRWLTPLIVLCSFSSIAAPTTTVPTTAPSLADPYARANRLAFDLGIGFGSASLSDVHETLDALLQDAPKSGLQINAEIAFRYYFAYHLMAQVGYGALYNWASKTYQIGILSADFSNHNLIMEIPILLGGYHTFFDRLYVQGAVGPSVFFYPRVFFEHSPDFKADGGAGFQVMAGADYLLAEHFSLGLEMRYRYLKTGDLKWIDNVQTSSGKIVPANTAVTADHLFGNGSQETYNLDFSGVSLALNLRFFIL
jgi:opacity protein-like surface antigen